MAKSRGQSSLEALFAFASLLAVLAMLMAASKPLSSALLSGVQDSAARIRLSQEAYSIDSACALSHAAVRANITGVVLSDGGYLALREKPRIRERLFCKSSANLEGGIHAQNSLEPV